MNVDKIKNIANFQSNAPNYKIMTWVLGNVCNYSCSYCPDELHNGKYKYPKLGTAIDIFNQFRGPRNDLIYYEIVGGEPTLWPDLKEYINTVSDENTFIEVNTNGSRRPEYWEKFDAKVDFFHISFHPESADEKAFTKTLEILSPRYCVNVSILAHAKHWNKVERFYNYLCYEREDLAITCLLSMIRPSFGPDPIPGLTEGMKKLWYKKSKHRARNLSQNIPIYLNYNGRNLNWRKFALARLNQFKGMSCDIPQQRLFIDVNGDIYYASCKQGGQIGNVYTGKYDFNTLPQSVICDLDYCACKFDAIIPKRGPYNLSIPNNLFIKK